MSPLKVLAFSDQLTFIQLVSEIVLTLVYYFAGGKNVDAGGSDVCSLLATIPRILPLYVPSQGSNNTATNSACVPWILLVSYG